jgi:hypothetical protein
MQKLPFVATTESSPRMALGLTYEKDASAFTSSPFDFVTTGLRTIQFLFVYKVILDLSVRSTDSVSQGKINVKCGRGDSDVYWCVWKHRVHEVDSFSPCGKQRYTSCTRCACVLWNGHGRDKLISAPKHLNSSICQPCLESPVVVPSQVIHGKKYKGREEEHLHVRCQVPRVPNALSLGIDVDVDVKDVCPPVLSITEVN